MEDEDKDSGFGDYGTESSDSSKSSSDEKESVDENKEEEVKEPGSNKKANNLAAMFE